MSLTHFNHHACPMLAAFSDHESREVVRDRLCTTPVRSPPPSLTIEQDPAASSLLAFVMTTTPRREPHVSPHSNGAPARKSRNTCERIHEGTGTLPMSHGVSQQGRGVGRGRVLDVWWAPWEKVDAVPSQHAGVLFSDWGYGRERRYDSRGRASEDTVGSTCEWVGGELRSGGDVHGKSARRGRVHETPR